MVAPQGGGGRYADRASQVLLAGALSALKQLIHRIDGGAGLGDQLTPMVTELHTARVPMEQALPQGLFQVLDRTRDHLGRYGQTLRRCTKVFAVSGDHENAQRLKPVVHDCYSSFWNSERTIHQYTQNSHPRTLALLIHSNIQKHTMNTTQGIQGKVIVITGASSGLGEASARHLAARGAKLVLAARRTDRLQALVQEITQHGGEAIAVATDVTSMEQMQALSDRAIAQFGRIDVLVNNAGIMPLAPLSRLKVEEWSRMIDVNIKGVLHGIAAVLPVMTQQKSGHIINVASVAGLKVFSPIGAVYSATKFAVRALSEGLRAEAPEGVRTTIISPGAVASELKLGSSDPDATAGVKAFYEANEIPAESVARAIAYAVEQSAEVDVNEIVLRPTVQDF